MRKLLLNPTPLFRKLRQLSMLLSLLLALPQTAWGQGSNQVSKTYTFKVTTLSGNTGTATSDITGGTVAETYTWNIKDFSRTIGSVAYTNGTVTPSNSKLGFSGDGIGRKLENGNYYAVQTTFVLESEAFTGEFVSATIEGYSSTGMSTAQVQVLRDEGTTASPLSYGENQHGYTTLSSTTSLPMSTLGTHSSNKYLDGNKLRFMFMFVSDNQSNNASFEIGSITITTIPLTPLEINWKLGGSVATEASYTFGSNDNNLPTLSFSTGYVGTITYTSSNENVATVDITGGVTPITSGEAIITATAPTTESFIGGTASYTLTVNKATPTISFTKWGTNSYNGETVADGGVLEATYGVAFKAPKPTFSNGEGLNDSTRFVYSYSVDGVVEFPNNGESTDNPGKIIYGEISLLKAGTVTITCTFPGNLQNNSCSASYTLQVNKADAAFRYVDRNSQTITTGNGFIDVDGTSKWGTPEAIGEEPTLSKPENATAITYTSSNNDVATVSTAGVVTPKGAGSATITATIKDDERYNDATASYTLTVMVPATISFANATASVLNTATYAQAATTDPAGSTITYSSSNNDVNVNTNGEVTINNSFYGKATITATVTAVPAADPQYYYVLPDNTAFQATYDLTVSKVFNSVTFEDGQNFATYYNDDSENMTVPEGLTAYLITGTSGNSVVTYPINYLPQNVPLLLEKSATASSTLTNTTFSGTELTEAEIYSNLLQYAEGDRSVAEIISDGGTPYVLYKNEFVKATGTIPGDHCYLFITSHAPSRGMYSIGDGNDGSTAIDATLIDNEETKNEDWFDLQGRRIQKPTKAGLYIVNGKKMVINNK